MTLGRCQRRGKMMCRGAADEGCVTEEKSSPVSGSALATSAIHPVENETSVYHNLFVQACKSLTERSPFDADDASAPAVTSLPASLLGFRANNPECNKRQKKLQLGVDANSSKLERKGSNIWVATEEYFREVTIKDVERLHDASSISQLINNTTLFLIPAVPICNASASAAVNVLANGNETNECEVGVCLENKAVHKEELEEVHRARIDVSFQEQACSVSQPLPSCSPELLLGSRDKIYLTSESPFKKRKRDCDMKHCETASNNHLIVRPVQTNSTLCHVCCLGDMNDLLNRLIVCRSCQAAVHQKCYGVWVEVDGSWLCSWCTNVKMIGEASSADESGRSLRPCVLCPMQGGALKPVCKNGGSKEFAHLFCSQWIPEVFIEDIQLMEPIMNVDGINEPRKELICYICKEKQGACVSCSNGSCGTSFHPICAREAGNKMEIWGKFGCQTIELQAFCLKHSEIQGRSLWQSGCSSIPVGFNPGIAKHQILDVGYKDREKVANFKKTEMVHYNMSHDELHETKILDKNSIAGFHAETDGATPSKFLAFSRILLKLIGCGKVHLKDVASEIGISPELLATTLSDDCLVSDLHYKIVKWLRNHVHLGVLQDIRTKSNFNITPNADLELKDGPNSSNISEFDFPDGHVKMVQSRRITKNNVRILKDNKDECSSTEISNDSGIVLNVDKKSKNNGADNSCKEFRNLHSDNYGLACKFNGDQCLESEILDSTTKDYFHGEIDKVLVDNVVFQDSMAGQSPMSQLGIRRSDNKISVAPVLRTPHCPESELPIASDLINEETISSSYVHPFISEKLMQLQTGVVGSPERRFSSMEASSSAGVCCKHLNQCSGTMGSSEKTNCLNLEQPEDELEGELIYYQHRLLVNAIARKKLIDDLICKIAKRLPSEIDAARNQMWDSVFVNQYLCKLRDLKKKGRKERRYKEAQALLAAATAAAAGSRISSHRKDSHDGSIFHENPAKLAMTRVSFEADPHFVPQTKIALPKVANARVSSMFNISKEHSRLCDICWSSETALKPLLSCWGCKVAVHLDCYCLVKDSAGLLYCQSCVDSLPSKCSRDLVANSRECGLCGRSSGAFRKSSNDQWVHAFCAEWVFESTFKRGQANPVEGMETVPKDGAICYICHCKYGVSMKCHYGHCQSTFHAFCGRIAGLYMNVRTGGSFPRHVAYCEKHSAELRAKAESRKRGGEEFKTMKQIRVELERLRLLCERIVRREKLKREFLICSHDILASKRDSFALSTLAHSQLLGVSSESATTSLMAHSNAESKAFQRSDDITVDSRVSDRLCIGIPNPKNTMDDNTSSPKQRSSAETGLISGKKIPHPPLFVDAEARVGAEVGVSPLDGSDIGERQQLRPPRKQTETFQKELVMTSDQASMKNQRLPKGYVYVPIGCLSGAKHKHKALPPPPPPPPSLDEATPEFHEDDG